MPADSRKSRNQADQAYQPGRQSAFRVELVTPTGVHVVRVAADEHILDAAEAQGVDLPATCRQGWCVTCAARLLEGDVDNSDALRYYPEDREAGFVLLCTARPRSDLRVVTHAKQELVQHRVRLGLPVPRG